MSDIIITPNKGSENAPTIQFSGSANASASIRLEVLPEGQVAFLGKSGSLFSISDNMVGSLMAVSDISGLPILEVFSDDRIIMGKYNKNTLYVSGTNVGVRKVPLNAVLDVSGSVAVTGSLGVAGSILADGGVTASLLGTASYALNALTASYSYSGTSGSSGSSGISGGTANYVARFTGATTLSTGVIYDNATNVGIGTTTPGLYDGEGNDLVVFKAATAGITIAVSDTSSRTSIKFADGTTGNEAYRGGIEYDHGTGLGGTADSLHFRTAAALRMAINGSGNVGIGTPSPLASLHVQKASSNTLGILERITTSSTVLGESVYLRLIDAAAGGTARAEIGFGYKGTAYQPAAIGYVATSGNGNTMGALYLATRDDTADLAPTERMRIASTGDVTISSTTAGSSGAGALVVQGGISAGAASYFGGSISFPSDTGIISTVNDGRLFIDGSLNQSGGSIVLFGSAHASFPAHTIYSANTHVYKNISGTQQLSLSLTAATFAGAVTVSSTTPTATLTRTSGTDSPRLNYGTGTASAIIGMSGEASGLVGSSIEGDLVLRTAASQSIRFTVDGGTTSAAVLSSTGATFAGAVTSTQFQSDVYRQQSGDRSLLSFSGVETALGGGTPGDTTKINANGVQALRIDASLLATFAGAVTVNGTQTNLGGAVFTTTNNVNIRGTNAGIAIYNSVSGSSNNWSTIRNTAAGSDSNLIFSTSTADVLTLDASANATFAGAVTGNSTFSSGVQSTTAGGYRLFDAGGYSVNFRPTAALTYVIEGAASGNDYLTSFTNAGAGKHNLAASGTLAITGAATFAGAVTASAQGASGLIVGNNLANNGATIQLLGRSSGFNNWMLATSFYVANGNIGLVPSTTVGGSTFSTPVFELTPTGAATFAGDVSAKRLEAVDAAANNRNAAFFRTQNNTTYSSSVLGIQGDRTTTNASYNLISATNGDLTGVFAVRDSGNAVNTNNSYGSTSDRKLKENIVDATSKLEKLNQVRIVNFNRIGNEQKQLGVIAQELEQIFPSMIEEAIDRDAEGNDLGTTTKSVKYSVFVPMLIKAVQELTARLAAVEAK